MLGIHPGLYPHQESTLLSLRLFSGERISLYSTAWTKLTAIFLLCLLSKLLLFGNTVPSIIVSLKSCCSLVH